MCFILFLAFKPSVILKDLTSVVLYFIPVDLSLVSSKKTFIDFNLSGSFIFLKESVTFLVTKFIIYLSVDLTFHCYDIFNPQQVFPSKKLSLLFLWCVSVWTHKDWPTNGFLYWLSIFDALEQQSRKRGTIDTLICIGQYLWSPVSMMIIQDSYKAMCVENHQESSRNSFKKLSLDLRDICLLSLGVHL